MRPEKAARISSYLAKNSARISIMSRKRDGIADYYEKSKYAECVFSEEANHIAKHRERLNAHKQPQKKQKNFLFGNSRGKSNVLGFGLIIVIMMMAMILMK